MNVRDSVGREIAIGDIVLRVVHTDFGVKLRHFKVMRIEPDPDGEYAWIVLISGINHSDNYTVAGTGSTCEKYCNREQRLYILSKCENEFESGREWREWFPLSTYMAGPDA